MNENTQTYLIPDNFIDETRVFNGMLRVKNLIEAVIILVMIAGPCILFIPKTVTAKFGITLACSLPLTMLALAGVNDDSLTTFIRSAVSWRKNRQIMLYNDNARTFNARPVDVMLSEVYVSDVLMNSLEKWRAQRSQRDAMVDLVENVDFVFKEDDEYFKMTPQEERTRLRQQKKEAKKNKGKKAAAGLPASLPETSPTEDSKPELVVQETAPEESAEDAEKTDLIADNTAQIDLSKAEELSRPNVLIEDNAIEKNSELPTNEDIEPAQFEEMDETPEIFVFDDTSGLSSEPETEIIGFEEDEALSDETFSFEIQSEPNTTRRKRTRKRSRKKSQNGGGKNA